MFLGIDLGTSSLKAVLVDTQGQLLGSASVPLAVSHPHPLWAEQNPDDWWHACCTALQQLKTLYPHEYAAVRGLGLSGQMHGAVLLDATGTVIRPAILWNDTRSHQECADLTRLVPQLTQITGNLAMPGFTAPKLLWLAKHEREAFARVAKVLLPKDYLRYKLTAEFVTDLSDAAGTLWLDVARRDWSDTLLLASGLSRQHMPRLMEGSAPSAHLRADVAASLGLDAHPVVVAGGAGDNAASAVGMGLVDEGQGLVSLGTSGVIFVTTTAHRPNTASAVHAFCHAVPHRWHQMSVMLSAASCLRWICQLTGQGSEAQALQDVALLSEQERRQAPLFLPYLSGERTPHNDPFAKGVLLGLSMDTTTAQLVYAVIEGVAFGMRDGLLALQQVGTHCQTLSLVGGGAQSDYWAQLLTDVLQTPLSTHVGAEAGAALGAARLGMMAAGLPTAQVCTQPPVLRRFTPQSSAPLLMARFDQFQALYLNNQTSFQRFANL